MEQGRLQWLFGKIAEGEGQESIDAAMEIINSAPDSVMHSEFTNFMLAMMQAKTSTEQDEVINSLKLYFKKQMGLLFIQAFTYGQKYQHAIDLVVIPQSIEKALEEAEMESYLKEEEE